MDVNKRWNQNRRLYPTQSSRKSLDSRTQSRTYKTYRKLIESFPPLPTNILESVNLRSWAFWASPTPFLIVTRCSPTTMFALERRRLRGDVIAFYKLLKGDGKTRTNLLKVKSLTRTCGHDLRSEESQFKRTKGVLHHGQRLQDLELCYTKSGISCENWHLRKKAW